MSNRLVKLALELVEKYKANGPSILVNCQQCPEFQTLMDHVKGIKPEQLGIKVNEIKSYLEKSQISYFNIIEDQDISIGVFCIAKGASLNLHDHPNMLVLSKILHGAVHSRSMDLVDRSAQHKLPVMLYQNDDPVVIGTKLEAIVAFDGTLKAGDISFLTPEKKNVHSFTAVEDTALLDILVPNYDDTTRFCNFYSEILCDDNEEIKINGNGTDKENRITEQVNSNNEIIMESHGSLGKLGDISTKEEKHVPKLKKPGEKTTLMYMLPPFDMHVQLLPYEGEPIENIKKE